MNANWSLFAIRKKNVRGKQKDTSEKKCGSEEKATNRKTPKKTKIESLSLRHLILGMECASRLVFFYGANGFVKYTLRNILPIRLRVDPYIPVFSPLKGMLYSKNFFKNEKIAGEGEGRGTRRGVFEADGSGRGINMHDKEFLTHAEQYFDHVCNMCVMCDLCFV